ncbi:MAG: DUF4142 domain-containing protein [Flavobacteriales bacterium]
MKTKQILHLSLLCMALIAALSAGFMSCTDTASPDDTKQMAENSNDAKLNNERKEKDAQFLVDATELNLQEIKLGQLAQQYSTNKEVQHLGEMMEDAHTIFLIEITELARTKKVTVPTALTDNGQKAYDLLSKKSGINFDRGYCNGAVMHHEEAIKKFETTAKESTDEQLQTWTVNTLRNLRMRLDHAKTCKNNCDQMDPKK